MSNDLRARLVAAALPLMPRCSHFSEGPNWSCGFCHLEADRIVGAVAVPVADAVGPVVLNEMSLIGELTSDEREHLWADWVRPVVLAALGLDGDADHE
jgi:hypothetical protein